ncbi:MAG TPA: hypothetical protein VGH28_08870 [Polyangiaceae bacterium]|jgi:hypothetical protein
MATVLVFAPLLAAQVFAMGHVREVRAHGVTVRAVAHDHRNGSDAEIEIRRGGPSQVIELRGREIGAAMLLQSIEIVDANFDGHPDVLVMREFGAKWSSSDVFLFDPRTQRFSATSPLAHAIGALANTTFDARRRTITTHDIGPSDPSRVTYAVEGQSLRETSSCRFVNPLDLRVGTLVRKTGERTRVTHVRLGASDVNPCD